MKAFFISNVLQLGKKNKFTQGNSIIYESGIFESHSPISGKVNMTRKCSRKVTNIDKMCCILVTERHQKKSSL